MRKIIYTIYVFLFGLVEIKYECQNDKLNEATVQYKQYKAMQIL